MPPETDSERTLFRHTLATVAYRGGKTLCDAGADFATFRAGENSRTSLEIVSHIGDLFEWALSIAQGHEKWINAESRNWEQAVERFFATLQAFDDYLASAAPLNGPLKQLFQGPIADALTHVGQLAMMRALAGNPIRGENYFKADIAAGSVGAEQSAPRREF
jgi:hypothetical protein